MILVADSGSTKTHWSLCTANGQHSEFVTDGINPFYQSENEIRQAVEQQLWPSLQQYMWIGTINAVYFYGAGCTAEKKGVVSAALSSCFPQASVSVESDLLAAARALFGQSAGIACILGTGSNSCYYDGSVIVKNVSPLGFILGDEGSGAVLGRILVGNVLKNQLDSDLCERFFAAYKLTAAEILENVYKRPFPNRFLAGFSKFLSENISHPAIYNIVYDSFDAFVVRNVLQYETKGHKVGFVGSVAYYYADVLKKVLDAHDLELADIMQEPLEGLIHYHKIRK